MGRLHGLDLARFFAFAGMVIVNFRVVMGASGDGWAEAFGQAFEGRAAATFVVLAGIGIGLAVRAKGAAFMRPILWRRAAVLLVIGLANSVIFQADILHYYAIYFLFAALLLAARPAALLTLSLALSLGHVALIFLLPFDQGWDWATLYYTDFWTVPGFLRNLFYNGFHPVIPWLGFMLVGMALARLDLTRARVQTAILFSGLALYALAEAASGLIAPLLGDDFGWLAGTAPLPPTPLYMLAGTGAAMAVIGLCLRLQGLAARSGLLGLLAPAGRQTLTLYVLHILLGMGLLEELGMLGGQTADTALLAAALFCLFAILYAWIWARILPRGPLEALMRRLAG